ncbi:MAG: hypothetical protein LQ351_006544, partial [Letrouitia transgressa]
MSLQYCGRLTSYPYAVPIMEWITKLLNASRDFERDPCPGPKLGRYLRDAGFINVEERKFRLPIGPWPKDKHL